MGGKGLPKYIKQAPVFDNQQVYEEGSYGQDPTYETSEQQVYEQPPSAPQVSNGKVASHPSLSAESYPPIGFQPTHSPVSPNRAAGAKFSYSDIVSANGPK